LRRLLGRLRLDLGMLRPDFGMLRRDLGQLRPDLGKLRRDLQKFSAEWLSGPRSLPNMRVVAARSFRPARVRGAGGAE
jgi:hypothetical protein